MRIINFILFLFLYLSSSVSSQDISLNYSIPKKIIEGSESYINISIKNKSEDNVFILSDLNFYFVKKLAGSYNWRSSEYGNIIYNEEKDIFVYDQIAQRATQNYFYNKILFPGQKEKIKLFFKSPSAGAKECLLKLFYKKLDFEELSKTIYVPKEKEGVNIIYKHPQLEEVKEFKKELFLKFLIKSPEKWESLFLDCTIKISSRKFSLNNAFKILGFVSEDYHFSTLNKYWVVGRDKDTYIVTKKTKEKFEKIPYNVFSFIEAQKNLVYINIWSEIDEDFKKELSKYGKIEKHKCYHLSVPKKVAINLLKEFIKRGYDIEMGEFQFRPAISIKKFE